ncbi:MAG: hypothetical protein IAE77_08625 [Prosthecobacter sp.]|jgi:hypothetical protein|uniref:hypothetical protein n=1 Tax=Prosthecobacter sp. TaxID=1965333 RepID=UPI0019DD4351|nr:hypothetical protein [Prosthecobacter sp.]MBE2283514.1 hypothetical protein [Prosthecobacter sp.]
MLSSRSIRLAATLLLALLSGWTIRAWRKGGPHDAQGRTTAPASAPAKADAKNAFPDE